MNNDNFYYPSKESVSYWNTLLTTNYTQFIAGQWKMVDNEQTPVPKTTFTYSGTIPACSDLHLPDITFKSGDLLTLCVNSTEDISISADGQRIFIYKNVGWIWVTGIHGPLFEHNVNGLYISNVAATDCQITLDAVVAVHEVLPSTIQQSLGTCRHCFASIPHEEWLYQKLQQDPDMRIICPSCQQFTTI